MSPVDGVRSVAQAAASVREVGDLAAAAHVRLAVEFNSQAAQLNTLGRVREVLDRAAHPACGLLLDTYHLHRSGSTVRDLDDMASSEIAYVQYSDVPRAPPAMPRLAPASAWCRQGVVPRLCPRATPVT
jgi:sugar phosphate isomerase/epimerase